MVMTHFPQPHPRKRAPRINLGKPVQAIVVQEDGQHTTGKLQTVSVTGGLLQLGAPISAGNFVELAFQTQSSTVHGMAEMMKPVSANSDALQPFRFIALDDDDHRALRTLAEVSAEKNLLSVVSNPLKVN
jgi:ACT domain-containing protein